MIIECGKEMELRILSFLETEAEYNTFLTADIQNFGFDKEFQKVYASVKEGEIKGIFLGFYQNLIVSGSAEPEDREFLEEYIEKKRPQVIMGKEKDIEELLLFTKDDYSLKKRPLYHLKSAERLETAPLGLTRGKAGDEDKIHSFLMSIEEIKGLYRSKEMIADRLKNRDGFHYYLEENEEIIAHGNSTAIGPYSAMIGGVSVKPEHRKKGIGGRLVSEIAAELLKMGLVPCLFSDCSGENNLFTRLGFEKIGMWATLERR